MRKQMLFALSMLMLNACGEKNYASKSDLNNVKTEIKAEINSQQKQIIPKSEVESFIGAISNVGYVRSNSYCSMTVSNDNKMVSTCSDKKDLRELKLMFIDRYLNFPTLNTEKFDFSKSFYILNSSDKLDEISTVEYRISKTLIANLENTRNILTNLCISEYRITSSINEEPRKYCNTKNKEDCVKLMKDNEETYLISYSQSHVNYTLDIQAPVVYKELDSASPSFARIVAFNKSCPLITN